MGRIFILVTVLFTAFSAVYAQSPEAVAVELSAKVAQSPAQITLLWKLNPYFKPRYTIYKKAKTATSWGASIATITYGPTDTQYVDNAVVVDSAYEYQVIADTGGMLVATGYIFAGIKKPAIHNRGILELIVDSTFTITCTAEIKTLMNDLSGDGWQIIRHDYARSASVTAVKADIANDYTTHTNVNAALLLGHIPVPYSGDLNPDAHPQHLGAWPTDVYYATMAGTWTDVTVNDVSGSYTANHNVPADGKFDQTTIPADVVLEIGRVDFYDMPSFTATEPQLMKSYLARAHSYKMDSLAIRHRGIISDNFGYLIGTLPEAFAENGWRNFAPLVGKDSLTITSSGFISSMATDSYQWGYACGGGSFTNASGIGATSDYAANPANGIFMMAFGSYFGDWNVTDNFLRAPLCSSTPLLANCWAGRPSWFFHHMALGENIGYCARLTQNNSSLYGTAFNYAANWVHIALMGDPSLRTDYIQPVTHFAITNPTHDGAHLSWTASADPAVVGYYVYRADSAYGYYQRLNTTMLTPTTLAYHDYTGTSGVKYYQVRPVKLQTTPSGNYYNLGLGVIDSVTVSFGPLSVATIASEISLSVFPNPAQSYLTVTINAAVSVVATMYMVNEAGVQLLPAAKQLSAGDNRYSLNIAELPAGVYSLVVNTGSNTTVRKWVKL